MSSFFHPVVFALFPSTDWINIPSFCQNAKFTLGSGMCQCHALIGTWQIGTQFKLWSLIYSRKQSHPLQLRNYFSLVSIINCQNVYQLTFPLTALTKSFKFTLQSFTPQPFIPHLWIKHCRFVGNSHNELLLSSIN